MHPLQCHSASVKRSTNSRTRHLELRPNRSRVQGVHPHEPFRTPRLARGQAQRASVFSERPVRNFVRAAKLPCLSPLYSALSTRHKNLHSPPFVPHVAAMFVVFEAHTVIVWPTGTGAEERSTWTNTFPKFTTVTQTFFGVFEAQKRICHLVQLGRLLVRRLSILRAVEGPRCRSAVHWWCRSSKRTLSPRNTSL